MATQPPLSHHRKRDRIYGLSTIVLAFAGCMALSVWGMRFSTPRPAPLPPPASQEDISGFPSEVRPFELLERARGLTVRQKFRGFEAKGVHREGHLDLSSPTSSLRFVFQSPQGRGPQPQREPGTLPERRYCGTQSVVVDHAGIIAWADHAKTPCGGKEIEDLPPPVGCTIEKLWAIADSKKMKKKGTADVEYFEAQGGAAFRFEKDRRSFVVSARDCKTELKGRDQRGILPRR